MGTTASIYRSNARMKKNGSTENRKARISHRCRASRSAFGVQKNCQTAPTTKGSTGR